MTEWRGDKYLQVPHAQLCALEAASTQEIQKLEQEAAALGAQSKTACTGTGHSTDNVRRLHEPSPAAKVQQIHHRIRRERDELFLIQAKLEIKALVGESVKMHDWRNRVRDAHVKMVELLRNQPIAKGEPVLDFSRRKWGVREKRFRNEVQRVEQVIELVQNAIRACLAVVEGDLKLAGQLAPGGLREFYTPRENKQDFLMQLIVGLDRLRAKK